MDHFAASPVKPRSCSRAAPVSVIGILLITIGTLIFLDNLGVLPVYNIGAYWPLAISAYGLTVLWKNRGAIAVVWGATIALAGVVLTLGNLGMIRSGFAAIWPLFLIAWGVLMLIGRFRYRRFTERYHFAANTNVRSTANNLHEVAVCSALKRRVDSQNFQGGDLASIFGGIEVDLRRAAIPSGEAVVEANAVFGGIELLVPAAWRVNVQGSAVLGAYEDQTMEPVPQSAGNAPVLIVRGATVFGGVTIKN